MKTIGLFVGSLRKESNSLKIAKIIQSMAPEGFKFEIIPIGHLPFYNQDFDDYNLVPEPLAEFRKTIQQLDGVMFITPEYNRSVPAVLKNAIDSASRPYGKNRWTEKPGAVVSCSTGALAAFGANHHLRQTLTFVNVYTMQQPEAYLGNIRSESFDENGQLKEQKTTEFIKKVVDAYIAWFHQLKK